MPQFKHCPKCSGSMGEGFVVDATHGGVAVSSWVEGPPQKSAWTGLKLAGRARSEIATWRCERCGFLEHYALAAPDLRQEAAQRRQVLQVVGVTLGIVLVTFAALLLWRAG